MGNKKAQEMRAKQAAGKQGKQGKPAPRPPKPVVIVANVLGEPSIEDIENGRQVVMWVDVHGHGRIKVKSAASGVYHASAVDPGAATAAEAGAGAYCEQHGEEMRRLYGQLNPPVAGPAAGGRVAVG